MCDDKEQDFDTDGGDNYELPEIPDDDIGYLDKGLEPDDE